jgi:lipoprotein-releasing system permease protein
MIGVLKSLGAEDKTIRRVFLYQAAYLIGKGLFWGNLVGIGTGLAPA